MPRECGEALEIPGNADSQLTQASSYNNRMGPHKFEAEAKYPLPFSSFRSLFHLPALIPSSNLCGSCDRRIE
jgi:hypothetical protein